MAAQGGNEVLKRIASFVDEWKRRGLYTRFPLYASTLPRQRCAPCWRRLDFFLF
ncbi:unnamed protein product [Nesidiocoris tenuis]|uniref:Uncharacterized protein n=1 Tax=Nesidiocoris tenuis TaxID=355587 RepID=A0A6H5GBI1_9HEMI|nr:unnamed protein product [Nesidiocoris tenuis]